MRIIKRYKCIFKQCRSMCQDIHDKHLLYVLKKSFYRRMNLVPFHARIKKIFRGGGVRGIFTMMLLDPRLLFDQKSSNTVSSLHITTTQLLPLAMYIKYTAYF